MFKSHCFRIIKNKYKLIFIFLLIILPCFEIPLLLLFQSMYTAKLNPCFSMFLDCNNNFLLIQQVYLWFLPLYYLLLISDDPVEDYKLSYNNVLISKIGKKQYINEKLISSFFIPFFIMFLSLILNYILVFIVFKGGDWWILKGIDLPNNKLFTLSVGHPVVTNIVYSIVTSFFCGLSSSLGCAFSLIFKNKLYCYPATFLVWYILSHLKNPLTILFQPFTEHDFNTIIPSFLISVTVFLVLIIAIYIYEVYHEKI